MIGDYNGKEKKRQITQEEFIAQLAEKAEAKQAAAANKKDVKNQKSKLIFHILHIYLFVD